ncbi:MAG: exopolysaccharide biosynthesis protein [Parvularculaceae bacterium]
MNAAQRRPVENLTGLLDGLCELFGDGETEGQVVSVRALLDVVGARAFGPVILAIGLFAVSPITYIPGTTWASSLAAVLIAGQLAIGWKAPWLPKQALDATFSTGLLLKSARIMRPWASRVDRVVKPRLAFLAGPPFANVFAVLCVLAALTCFPLGLIPFAPTAPSFAIALIGLGLTAKDGFVLLFSAAPAAIGLWLVL